MSRYQLLVIMIKRLSLGSSMVVQWLGLSTSIAMVLGSISGWRAKIPTSCAAKKKKEEKKKKKIDSKMLVMIESKVASPKLLEWNLKQKDICSPPVNWHFNFPGILENYWYSCARSCLTLFELERSPPGSSVHGIFQAKILEWVAISSSRGPSRHRHWTRVFCISCVRKWILSPLSLLGSLR